MKDLMDGMIIYEWLMAATGCWNDNLNLVFKTMTENDHIHNLHG